MGLNSQDRLAVVQFPASLAFKASSLCLFRFPITLNVFSFSPSVIACQLEILLSVPSTLTTMGPRWSNLTDVPRLLMSSFVLGSWAISGNGSWGCEEIASDGASLLEGWFSAFEFDCEDAMVLIPRIENVGMERCRTVKGIRYARYRKRECIREW